MLPLLVKKVLCVAVWLQCGCSMLQYVVAVCCSLSLLMLPLLLAKRYRVLQHVAVRLAVSCSALQCVAVFCSVLQRVAVRLAVSCSALQCAAVSCSVLQRVAVRLAVSCSVLRQCVAV